MKRLAFHGSEELALLFATIGVSSPEGETENVVIVDREGTVDDELSCYVRLPNPEVPLAETERLARMLGRAIGLGQVRW